MVSFLTQYDVICFCESWTDFPNEFNSFLPNYSHFDSVRKSNLTSLRNSGGVNVFVKDSMCYLKIVTRIYEHLKDCVVLLFKFSSIYDMNDVIIYFTYISPEGSSIYNDLDDRNGINIMQRNFDQIINGYPNCNFMLIGDLNARTKDLLDFIPADNLEHIFGQVDYESSSFDLPRVNKDKTKVNSFGRSLVNFCCTHSMHFLNGRFDDDKGEFTCINHLGASVVDYIIASESLFPFIRRFIVLNRDESDHFPIECVLQLGLENNARDDNEQTNTIPLYSSFRWDPDKSEQFCSLFIDTLNRKHTDITTAINDNVNSAVKSIISIYQSCADSLRLRHSVNTGHTPRTNAEWYDEECKTLKHAKYKALRKFRNTNSIIDLHHYRNHKNKFKGACKTKKATFMANKRQRLLNCKGNMSSLWKLLKSTRKPSHLTQTSIISLNEWRQYFQSLLYSEHAEPVLLNDMQQEGDVLLNTCITVEEVIFSIDKLSLGKSCGNDGICSEFYKYTKDDISPILCTLFNKIFATGQFPYTWGESVICPVYKSGITSDPNNYRGISITTTMYKIFSCILNKRLYNWAEHNNIIDEAQAGFRRGYSAIDNVFCLQAMTQKYLSKAGGRFYCLYVDFKKAFDKICHVKLFQSLEQKGVDGKFLRILSKMYANIKSCVKLSSVKQTTEYFHCNVGTRQGDISSPVIFSIFINDLCSLLREKCGSGIFIDNTIPDILCLLFADDVANCAETVVKLQQQLNVIDQFCNETGMEVNLNKTEIIVFRNGGPLKRNERWYFRGNPVQTTSVYKYMGLLCTPSLSWHAAQEKLAMQAQKAVYSIYRYQRIYGNFTLSQLFSLFDALIKPILCYGAQIWGYKYVAEIENIQTSFCKRYLNVKKSTNTCIVLGECGRMPLCYHYYIICIKYWCKLLTLPDHRYPKRCYLLLKRLDEAGRTTWATYVKQLLFQYGFGYVWLSQDFGNLDMFICNFKQRLCDCLTQDWKRYVNESSRCHHYKYFKSLLNPETYLTLDLPYKLRLAMSRFRCASHSFQVETGRHAGIPFNERLCNFCLENLNIHVVQCEYHVFFHCQQFHEIRQRYLLNWYTRNNHNIISFYYLMQSKDENVVLKVATYVSKIFDSI